MFFYLLDDGSGDNTTEILNNSKLNRIVITYPEPGGLRNRCIDFFNYVRARDFDYIAKMDNDCVVPENWLSGLLNTFANSDADILSPNVQPSNASFQYGKNDIMNLGYRPAEIVGGLWFMKASLIKDLQFEMHDTFGLTGATTLLRQIVTENEPKIGWVTDVVVEDIGHWTGRHPDHIKSEAHEDYSKEVGRSIAWKAKDAVTV